MGQFMLKQNPQLTIWIYGLWCEKQ